MSRAVHFEIHVDDLDRAGKFYSGVFNWQFLKWDGPQEYRLITTGEKDAPGVKGGMMKRMDPTGSVYNTIDVPSVDDYVKKIEAAGGTIVIPKMPIPGVGWLAYFRDTAGNVSGIIEPDMSAK